MNTYSFSNNLRTLRQAKGYTQLQMSELLNIQRQSYCNYEHGHRFPSLDVLLKITDIFNISIDLLIRGTIDSTSNLAPRQSELSKETAQLLMDYQSLSPNAQKEVRDFLSFKLKNNNI